MRNKLENYLAYFEKERSSSEIYILVFYLFTITLVFLVLFNVFWLMVFPEALLVHKYYLSGDEIFGNLKNNVIPSAGVFLYAALFEECLYRLPIFLLYKFNVKKSNKIYLIILLSFIFSFAHFDGLDLYNFLNVLPYTFLEGLVFSLIYIVSGGKKQKIIYPLIIVTLIHFLLNVLVVSIQGVPADMLVN